MKGAIATYTDGYKLGHRNQYQPGTSLVVSNWTPRKSRIETIDKVVFFGQQAFIKEFLMKKFQEDFFSLSEDEACRVYFRRVKNYLGNDYPIETDHIRDLHRLGYVPMTILSIPEGARVPMRVPQSVMYSEEKFFWVVNYLETLSSAEIWKPCTSATFADAYRNIFEEFAMKTVGNTDFVPFQGHDFSFRGMSGVHDACVSGGAHLLSFVGTDTIPAIDWLEEYYGADSDKELVGCSVAATEHAVMCSATGFYVHKNHGGDWSHVGLAEFATFKRLITEVYPHGIVSIVSDTWDLWRVLVDYMAQLKPEIMARAGKVVIRPDSGKPEDILCGAKVGLMDHFKSREHKRCVEKGVIELLWDVFGGTISPRGYKVLDSHVGAIYGDSITLDRARLICERLMKKGFASTNWVAGIGSFTYQYQTRDTFGFAQKSTYCVVDGYHIPIFKDPITDDGTKKSARGLTAVYWDEKKHEYYLKDNATWEEMHNCALELVFKDGVLYRELTLAQIRAEIRK